MQCQSKPAKQNRTGFEEPPFVDGARSFSVHHKPQTRKKQICFSGCFLPKWKGAISGSCFSPQNKKTSTRRSPLRKQLNGGHSAMATEPCTHRRLLRQYWDRVGSLPRRAHGHACSHHTKHTPHRHLTFRRIFRTAPCVDMRNSRAGRTQGNLPIKIEKF